MSSAWLLLAALALDLCLGEPRRAHPLVAFGRLAERLQQRFNPGGAGWRSHGVSAWALAVLPLTLASAALVQLPVIGVWLEIFLLYLAIGQRSLLEHGQALRQALQQRGLTQHKAQPRTGHTEELAERAQHDQPRTRAGTGQAEGRRAVDERLVDHQPATTFCQLRVPVEQALRLKALPGGVVGVDQQQHIALCQLAFHALHGEPAHPVPGCPPGPCMFGIAGAEHPDQARCAQLRQHLQGRLRTGHGK